MRPTNWTGADLGTIDGLARADGGPSVWAWHVCGAGDPVSRRRRAAWGSAAMSKPETVDEYLEGFAAQARQLNEQLPALARAAVPDADAAIKWGPPRGCTLRGRSSSWSAAKRST